MNSIPEKWRWFPQARYGLFVHFGPYAQYGRGEQVLFREHLDQHEYAQAACAWNPKLFDARQWAQTAVEGGFRYAVLTTRHHDGYCLWNTQTTDYSSVSQVAGRDIVGEYVAAFREAGLHVGLYYSLADWRIPAYWEGPRHDPAGWNQFRDYCHEQVRELLTNYGKIDEFWFDGVWPRNARAWQSEKLLDMMRQLQPEILINNRLDAVDPDEPADFESSQTVEFAGESKVLGDFGTPEHHITAESNRLWESCQVSTWRLWGYTKGERWRPAEVMLDMLCEAAGKGGNLLMNVGPQPDGQLPAEFVQRTRHIGDWLRVHGEAIYDCKRGDVVEFVTRGWQTRKGNNLYLILRFWDGRASMRIAGLATRVLRATLLTTGQELRVEQNETELTLHDLPSLPPTDLFPVIKLEGETCFEAQPWARERLWCGNPRRMTQWAQSRGTSVWADGKPRE